MGKGFGKREKRLRAAGEAMEAFLARLGGGERRRLCALWNDWDRVLGPLASLALPLGQDNGVLLLGAEDSMALQEISLQSPEILERANAFMGGPVFLRVRAVLVQGRLPLNRRPPVRTPSPPAPARPPRLGGLSLPPDSPAGRCYAAYVAMFRVKTP
ncbi:MAG: DUF721 domain-containing protein [Desulfovibrio sp.]|jgi:hypothetical protein|nr:DUF721 domain-containing protein [Desulfovibrio sp.]